MTLYLKRRYYKRSKVGREPIHFHVRQPRGVGTNVSGEVWLDPVLRQKSNADLRKALLRHETDEINAWGKGKSGVHTKAKSQEPELIRTIGGVSGFWKEIKRRQGNNGGTGMKRNIPNKFDPKTMRRDKGDPKVIYYDRFTAGESVAFPETGYILIGVKDNPSKAQIKEILKHERGHLRHRAMPFTGIASIDYLTAARHELASYSAERKLSTPQEWSRILPSRIKQFMGYLTWVSKPYQAKIKPRAKRILSPKRNGGNDQAVAQAQADLAQWWLVEEKVPARLAAVTVRRPIKDINRELDTRWVAKPKPIKAGVAYTSGGRLCRKPHRGWERLKFT